MNRKFIAAVSLTFFLFFISPALAAFEKDVIKTDSGDLAITFIGHGTLMLTHNDLVIQVDPWARLADYESLPKADIILVTHEHFDHLDVKAIDQTGKQGTAIIANDAAAKQIPGATVMKNGATRTVKGIPVNAVPAYNLINKRPDGNPFHPKGNGNGYVFTLGGKKIYIAGDTENIPEMSGLNNIDIAFLPMNLPYTMTPEMVASAAKTILPKILYPYHFGTTDTGSIKTLLEGSGIDVRLRNMP